MDDVLTPDSFMAKQKAPVTELTPDSFMAAQSKPMPVGAPVLAPAIGPSVEQATRQRTPAEKAADLQIAQKNADEDAKEGDGSQTVVGVGARANPQPTTNNPPPKQWLPPGKYTSLIWHPDEAAAKTSGFAQGFTEEATRPQTRVIPPQRIGTQGGYPRVPEGTPAWTPPENRPRSGRKKHLKP